MSSNSNSANANGTEPSSNSVLICGLSGTIPTQPVVSRNSGIVYERRLIEKHIEAAGTEPGTSNPLSLSDLLALNLKAATVKLRTPAASSIPNLLSTLQSEWDSVMVESFSLKQQLDTVRQELAHTLYQHDAACRVIARLIKERDEARAALANAQFNTNPSGSNNNNNTNAPSSASGSMDVEDDISQGLKASSVRTVFDDTAKVLSKDRKKRVKELIESSASKETVSKFTLTQSHSLHSTTTSEKGISTFDVNKDLIVTGGNDSALIVFNKKTQKIVDTLRGHEKKITSVKFHPKNNGNIVSTSKDHSVKFWAPGEGGKYDNVGSLELASSGSGLSIHPSGDYGVVSCHDGSFNFFDVASAKSRQILVDEKSNSPLSDIQFHPDGLILATANDEGIVRVWDVKSIKIAATFKGHSNKITSVAFSENGYQLASADQNGQIKLWDLRKLSNVHTIEYESPVSKVTFDYSSSYLGAASTDGSAKIYSKDWAIVHQWKDSNVALTNIHLKLFKDSNSGFEVITSSLDRNLRIYSDSN